MVWSGACPGGSRRRLAPLLLLPFFGTGCTMAVHSSVHDQSGRPLPHAVVYATPKEQPRTRTGERPEALMAVENFAFDPPVLPVRVGTGVTFLNRDDVRHQIYSISAARTFDLVAERMATSAVVVFDRTGDVVLGCAARDGMVGHVYVVGTPYFATTGADGKAELEGLPRGAYEVRVWHPDLKASAAAQRVTDTPSHRVRVDFRIAVQPRGTPERPPAPLRAPPP